jgi:hypothetical protein
LRATLLLCAGLVLTNVTRGNAEDDFQRVVKPFLTKHCFRCHGEKKSEGELRLDRLTAKAQNAQVKILLKMQELLADGEMPPEDEPRPPKAETAEVQLWLKTRLAKAEDAVRRSGSRMPVRRLNRAEYDNTIRDLFGVDLKPARTFPEDDSAHGFDNVGSALTVSPLLLEKYMNAAQFVTDRVIFTKRPEAVKYRWKGVDLAGVRKDHLLKAGRLPPDDAGILFQLGPRANNVRNTSAFKIGGRRKGDWFPKPTVPGKHVIRFKAHVIGSGITPEFRWKIYYSLPHLENFPQGDLDAIVKFSKNGGMFERVYVARKPKVYEVSTLAEPGEVLSFNFENAPPNVAISRVGKEYPGPGLVIDWLEWEGPVFDQWPPLSHARIFFKGPDATKDREYAKAVLLRFANKAFRRPVQQNELDDLLQLFDTRLADGDSFERAVAAAIELALCSPSFLYLTEPSSSPKTSRQLNDYELASRLSYFLWSSMPDEKLFELASQGKLTSDEKTLETQVRRMLADPKAAAFTTNFVGQWLDLRKLKDIAVDQRLYPQYSDYLKTLLVRETEMFFEEILKHDLSVLNFIDSDFMMLNDRLAFHYGIKGIKGPEFRRVPVPADGHRGGLMGQASILTLTTCGTRTSPVLRGVWTLEKIFGQEPPPPPKEVPAITPDTRGATTIREQLAKHRADASCARCHNKIDPLGLALENYDVVGRWRDNYYLGSNKRNLRKGPAVDASVTMLTGEKVTTPDELRAALMKHKDRFCHSLVEKLLTYALGRGLDLGDRRAVGQLTKRLKDHDYRLSVLVIGIVKSESFQSK